MVAAAAQATSTVIVRMKPVALEDLLPGDEFMSDGQVWLVVRDPVVSTRGERFVSILCQSGDGAYAHAVGQQGYEVQPIHRESE